MSGRVEETEISAVVAYEPAGCMAGSGRSSFRVFVTFPLRRELVGASVELAPEVRLGLPCYHGVHWPHCG